jgi:hypothetical protein
MHNARKQKSGLFISPSSFDQLLTFFLLRDAQKMGLVLALYPVFCFKKLNCSSVLVIIVYTIAYESSNALCSKTGCFCAFLHYLYYSIATYY